MNNGAGTGLLPTIVNIGNSMRPGVTPLNNVNNFNWNEARRHYKAEPEPFEFLPAEPLVPMSYELLVTRFSSVLGLSEEDTRRIIDNLNPATKTTDFFTEISKKLPKFTKKTWFLGRLRRKTNTMRVLKKGNTTVKNVIYTKPSGSGASGQLYVSQDDTRAYKSIRLVHSSNNGPIQEFFESNIRQIFYEAFIQTILSGDRLHGRFILPVEGIFYEESAEPNVRTIIIQMPKLVATLTSAIEELGRKKGIPIDYRYIRHVLKSITETLIHFKQLYGFRHCDLHMGNIMYRDTELREPYIIDFGRSCLTFNGIAYYNSEYHSRCESNDLLILLVHMLSVSNEAFFKRPRIVYLDDATYGVLFNALICANPNYNFYETLIDNIDIIDNSGTKYDHIFHAVYPNEMNPGGPVYEFFNERGLLPLPHIDTPEAFLAYLNNVDKTTIENLETPAARHELGARIANRRARKFRISTMAFRHPLKRQKGTRHLIGGNRIHFRTRRRR
jgi:hypothetical protein